MILKKFPIYIEYTDNKNVANKIAKVNNQSIYNQRLNRFSRAIAVRNLHDYVSGQVKKWKPVKRFPIFIEYEIHTVINHGSITQRNGKMIWKQPKKGYVPNWDADNLAVLWIKTINDTLVKEGILPEDTVDYVIGANYRIKFVDNLDLRKIIIKFKRE